MIGIRICGPCWAQWETGFYGIGNGAPGRDLRTGFSGTGNGAPDRDLKTGFSGTGNGAPGRDLRTGYSGTGIYSCLEGKLKSRNLIGAKASD